ncbi:MAG: PIN domain nuclease [Rhodospirillales bacterium]|nr:PIN domain nuclease [Rhodospirillales bacterium]
MIVADSSVWIDFFNGTESGAVYRLRAFLGKEEILVGDLILCEVMQGFRDEKNAAIAYDVFLTFDVVSMVGPEVALQAAKHYRILRRRGVTVRKTIDLLIGTYCIRERHALLHNDRDFDPMAAHLGLVTA